MNVLHKPCVLYNEAVQSFPVSYYSDEPIHSPLKVSLFTRIHEMTSTLAHLSKIAQKPQHEKQLWLAENEELLQRVLDNVIQEDPIHFEEPDMDAEMMKLLVEYTAVLQDLVRVTQSIFKVQKQTESLKPTTSRSRVK
jgi:hypothetical protein